MNKLSTYYKNLISSVLELSDSSDWQSAVLEWAIEDVVEDETLSESCVCGKENLRYLFTIRNTINGNKLYPIGSTCIKKFERSDLDEIVSVKEQLFKLLHAIENNEFITLSSQYFSRRLLRYLMIMMRFYLQNIINTSRITTINFCLICLIKEVEVRTKIKKQQQLY